MPTIKFSHPYTKLLDINNQPITEAILLDCFIIRHNECSEAFLNYGFDDGLYKLKEGGSYIMLLFQKSDATVSLFTTLKPYDCEKYLYYNKLRGQEFKVEVKE